MSRNGFHKFLDFLTRLEADHIPYTLAHYRDDTVMVTASVPGERWEIEFLDDGTVEVEKFVSDGQVYEENSLDELFERYEEQEPELFNSSVYSESKATALQVSS